jgi:hypothetical protein
MMKCVWTLMLMMMTLSNNDAINFYVYVVQDGVGLTVIPVDDTDPLFPLNSL